MSTTPVKTRIAAASVGKLRGRPVGTLGPERADREHHPSPGEELQRGAL
ncbi:MAG TPA: hypothetical protein VGF41_12230 [Myxococcaceae bacterium]